MARHQIVAFDGAYHGDTFGAMAVGERNLFNEPFDDKLFPRGTGALAHTWWGDETIEAKEQAALACLEQQLETPTAAVILEPLLQGAGGMAMVRPRFVQEVAKRVKQSQALLIADEVLTGFGRTGDWFASHRAGDSTRSDGAVERPDRWLFTHGRDHGQRTDLSGLHRPGPQPDPLAWPQFHRQPWAARPPMPVSICSRRTRLHFRTLKRATARTLSTCRGHSKVSRCRLLGTVAAFDLDVDGTAGYLNPAGPTVKKLVMAHGVFLRPLGQVVYLLPPLCISDEQLQRCYEAIGVALDAI